MRAPAPLCVSGPARRGLPPSGGGRDVKENEWLYAGQLAQAGAHWTGKKVKLESLIMAQIERWRHA